MAGKNYLRFKNETILRDTLYNLHPRSGATVEYCTGMVVGIVGNLMANGLDFKQAIDVVACYMPDEGRLTCPASWQLDLASALLARGKKWAEALTVVLTV